jgi:hypothetical protein
MKPEATPPWRTHPFHLVLLVRTLLLVALTLSVGLLGEIGPRETGTRIDAHDRMLHAAGRRGMLVTAPATDAVVRPTSDGGVSRRKFRLNLATGHTLRRGRTMASEALGEGQDGSD